MAFTLTVEISDSEQARILEIAAVVVPDATPAQIKTWAERTMKKALRAEIVGRRRALWADAENEARAVFEAEQDADWPPDA